MIKADNVIYQGYLCQMTYNFRGKQRITFWRKLEIFILRRLSMLNPLDKRHKIRTDHWSLKYTKAQEKKRDMSKTETHPAHCF